MSSKKKDKKDVRRVHRADALRNRGAILEATEALLKVEGPGLSTEKVAKRAGVGIGTVFRHFPTKRELLQAVAFHRLEQLTEEADTLLLAFDEVSLFSFLRRIARLSSEKGTLVHAMESLGIDAKEWVSEAGVAFRDSVGRLLLHAQKEGVVRKDLNASDVLELVLAIAYVAAQGDWDEAEDPPVLRVILDGLRPRAEGL